MMRSTKPEPELRLMSKLGATEVAPRQDHLSPSDRVAPLPIARHRGDAVSDDFFVPDFCATRMVFAIVLVVELLAVTMSLARPDVPFLTELARLSMFLQWLGLTSAALLCSARPYLKRLSVPRGSAAVFVLLLANTTLISEVALWLGDYLSARGVTQVLFPRDHWPFVLRNLGICVIVTAMLLRYFFVTQQWRHHVRAEARSRIEALQARIRPHFLFNSMNTIASLTRTDPARAEEAVEDLADLFRATLRDSQSPLRLKEELELTRVYQRIEELRLGDRLRVHWDVDALPMRAFIPGLTVQPLLENAIYHGIEPGMEPGTVRIRIARDKNQVRLLLANPYHPDYQHRAGNRMALANIRERLALHFDVEASLATQVAGDKFEIRIVLPYRRQA